MENQARIHYNHLFENGSPAEEALAHLIVTLATAAIVLIEQNPTVTRPSGELYLLSVLVTFQSNDLMSYAARGGLGGVS